MGRGGGQVVSVLAFNPNNMSSMHAEAKKMSVKFVFENNENKEKEAEIGHLKTSFDQV